MSETLFITVAVVSIIAIVSDIHYQKIPNLLTLPTVLGAIIYHTWSNGLDGFLFSIEGAAAGIAFLIVPYALGVMGAGDVKLMGAIGGLLGPQGVFHAFVFTALAGGVYSIVLLLLHGHLKRFLQGIVIRIKPSALCAEAAPASHTEKGKRPQLYYGLAISIGTLISVTRGSI